MSILAQHGGVDANGDIVDALLPSRLETERAAREHRLAAALDPDSTIDRAEHLDRVLAELARLTAVAAALR